MGMEAHVSSLLEPLGIDLEFSCENVVMEFPSIEEQVDHMERTFGPIVTAKAALGDDWPAARAAFVAFMFETNEAEDGTGRSTNEYLQTIGRKAQ